jgi:hypothetical protein
MRIGGWLITIGEKPAMGETRSERWEGSRSNLRTRVKPRSLPNHLAGTERHGGRDSEHLAELPVRVRNRLVVPVKGMSRHVG